MKSRIALLLLKIFLALIALSLAAVLLFKWAPVRVTPLMLKRAARTGTLKWEKKWVKLEDISPQMAMAVIASEDNLFDTNNGFALEEIRKMRESHIKKGTKIRGCSTISQQTAKNCFTWCSSTWVRKAFEAWWTVLIEKFWGKRRIMEVYLNVIELGDGIYGVQAASLHYFGKPASKLSASEAAALAYCLPNPLKRTPVSGTRYMLKRRSEIMSLMRKVARPEWLPGRQ